jgi:hypothetical protein
MRRYLYTFAVALLVGLGLGFWLWYSAAPPKADRIAGILIATPKGRLHIDKVERVRAQERETLMFVVVNASDQPRTMSLAFFRGGTPVNVCDADIEPISVASQRFTTVTCRVGRGIIDRFPPNPEDEDEKGDPNVRAFDYKISFDGETYYDPRLVIRR